MNPRFFHFGWWGQLARPGKRKHDGVLTIAYRIKEDKFYVGFVFCSPQDNFSRKEGRKEALKIMRNSPIIVPQMPSISSRKQIINAAQIICSQEFPEDWVVPKEALIKNDIETSRIPGWAKKWWNTAPTTRTAEEGGQQNPFLMPINKLVQYAKEAGIPPSTLIFRPTPGFSLTIGQ
jgi:hypothetical protein